MNQEAALVAVSCVLFVQMGLSGTVQEILHFKSRILSCPKCLTFWVVLAWELTHRVGLVVSIATSFILSYAALWSALILDGLTVLYNSLYDTITQTNTGSSQNAEAGDGSKDTDTAPDSDELPKM